MKLLMTASEAAQIAFGGNENIPAGILGDAVIIEAQQKFVKPSLGGLYAELENGRYEVLLEEYVKPALAQWVRWLILPSISVQAGPAGLVQYEGAGFSPAGSEPLARLMRRARASVEALTRAMIEHVRSMPDEYPEYPHHARRTTIAGGVVL